MLNLYNVSVGYGEGDVVKNISLDLKPGQKLSVIGPNGCGKTTLLKAIANILPFKGDILFDGKSVRKMKSREIAVKIAMLSQMSGMYFSYSVFETVMMGRYLHIKDKLLGLPSESDRQQVMQCLKMVGLEDEKDKEITKLSGGQLQRVFLARTLAQDPDIILLDEPTNHLDLKHQIELIEYLKLWVSDGRRAVIGVLHDINLAMRLADNLLIMKDGSIQAYGRTSEIISDGILEETYEINVAQHMRESLKIWENISARPKG